MRILSKIGRQTYKIFIQGMVGMDTSQNKEIFGESRATKKCFLFFFSGKNDYVRGQVDLILTVPHH